MNYVYVLLLIACANVCGMQQPTDAFIPKESSSQINVVFKKPTAPSTKRAKMLAKPEAQKMNEAHITVKKKLPTLEKYVHNSDEYLRNLFYKIYLPFWRQDTSPLKNLTTDRLLAAFKGLVAQERAKQKIEQTKNTLS